MKPEQQRIAIAEACGWTPDDIADIRHSYEAGTLDEDYPIGRGVPDYLNDLNAMHGAEKSLAAHQLWHMTAILAEVVPATTPIAHATAAQRAEAFLRTIGKWEDDK